MPVATELRIEAKDAKIGDHIPGGNIESVTRKDKYTYFKLDTGRNVRHEHANPIIVTREVPTEQEQAEIEAAKQAEMRAFIEADILKTIERSKTRLEQATAKLQEASGWNVESQWSPLSTYVGAVAERDIWARVEQAIGHTWGEHSDRAGQTVTIPDAVREVAKEMTEGLLSNRWRGSSSSDVSNSLQHAMREAASAWLRSYGVVSILSGRY